MRIDIAPEGSGCEGEKLFIQDIWDAVLNIPEHLTERKILRFISLIFVLVFSQSIKPAWAPLK